MLEEQETWFDVFLRYGLYAGAAFQLACIAAIVLLPPRKDGTEMEDVQSRVSTSAGDSARKGKPGPVQKRPKEKKKKK